MIKVDIDSSAVDGALADMQKHLTELPQQMANEFTVWQTEDMKRRRPNTDFDGSKTATTTITQHTPSTKMKKTSLVRMPRRRTRQVREARLPPGQRGRSKPILRESLFTQLCERMRKLMTEHLTWR